VKRREKVRRQRKRRRGVFGAQKNIGVWRIASC